MGFDWVLPSFTGFYLVWLGSTGFYWVLLGHVWRKLDSIAKEKNGQLENGNSATTKKKKRRLFYKVELMLDEIFLIEYQNERLAIELILSFDRLGYDWLPLNVVLG